ncbi:MAG: FIST C-terminal domain-containing protein [Rhodospirillaceae bacterium]|nr:FIST C-terminal domain-containing protein [Rhodospirillaceae bacterium]
MSAFVASHAADDDGDEAVTLTLAGLAPLPQGANLGFVYATDTFAAELPSLVGRLRKATGVKEWIGTVGLGVSATAASYFDRPALSVMIGALPEDSFRIFSGLEHGMERFRREHGAWISEKQPSFGVMHADPRNPKTPELVTQLADELPCYLVGGLTASRSRHAQVAGSGHGAAEGGISGVLFAGDVAVACGLSQGCSPIGPSRVVTDAEANVIKSIEGRPAVEMLKADLESSGQKPQALHVALAVSGSDTGDYLVRNLIGIDPDRGWVGIGDHVSAGDRVTFCRRDPRTAGEDLERMLGRLKARRNAAPAAGLYFSCVARGPHLFDGESTEAEMIAGALGAFPLTGFFGNGEISSSRLYGYTGVLALFD